MELDVTVGVEIEAMELALTIGVELAPTIKVELVVAVGLIMVGSGIELRLVVASVELITEDDVLGSGIDLRLVVIGVGIAVVKV